MGSFELVVPRCENWDTCWFLVGAGYCWSFEVSMSTAFFDALVVLTP